MPANVKHYVKGEVHFHLVGDDKLRSYRELIQDLLFEYKSNKSVCESLHVMYGDVVRELAERGCKVSTPVLRTHAPKVFRSPAKRKR